MKTHETKSYDWYRRRGYTASQAWEKSGKKRPGLWDGRAWWMHPQDKIGRTPGTELILLPKGHPMIRDIHKDGTGWYANAFYDAFYDETYTGAAFQMAGRWWKDSGDALYFPGYVEANGRYVVIDLSRPFYGGRDMFGDDEERDKCVRAGDDMAREDAEEARTYDELRQRGAVAARKADKLIELRRQLFALQQVPRGKALDDLADDLKEWIEEMEGEVREAFEDVSDNYIDSAMSAFRDGFESEAGREAVKEWLGEKEQAA